ncbi:lipopolysaccharide biosynthesis protein [Aeromonas salmonicida]
MTPQKIFFFAIGPVGGALFGVISLPIIAWIFSQEDVGRMALLNVVLSFATLFFTLGLDQAYVREFHEADNKSLLLKTTVIPGLILLVAALAVSLLFGPLLSKIIFGLDSIGVSWLLAIALFCSFLSRFLSLVLRMNERGLAFSMSQLLPKAFLLVIILFFLLFDFAKTFECLLLANTLAIMLAFSIFAWNTRSEWYQSFFEKVNISQLQKMLSFGFPLILGGLAFWGMTSLDRILLSRWSSYSELAIYSVSVSFAAAATIFQSVFSTVWAPMVYKWASKDEGYDKITMVGRYTVLFVVIIFCLAGMLSWVISFFLPAQYSSVQWILVACLAYPLFYTLSETTVVGIGIARKSAYSMLACILALLVNITCNFFLIPSFGAAGAASSTAISFWAFLVFRTEFSIYVWKSLPRFRMYIYTLLAVIGSIIGSLKQTSAAPYIYCFWFGLLLFCIFDYRHEVKMSINKIAQTISPYS